MMAPAPHLWDNVHAVSLGKLSVLIFTSKSVPAGQGVGAGVGFNVGKLVGSLVMVGCKEMVGKGVGSKEMVGLKVG